MLHFQTEEIRPLTAMNIRTLVWFFFVWFFFF